MTRWRTVGAVALALALVAPVAACSSSDSSDSSSPSSSGSSGGVIGIANVQGATIYISAFGFEEKPEGASAGASTGSGFFIDETGLAMTNYHVVAGAVTLEAYVGGDTSRTYPVSVVGASQCNDLALVQVKLNAGETVPYLNWHEGEPTVGLPIYAAGYPLSDTEFTLTSGIVSKARANGEQSWASIDYTIEIDASIQPGNSGGPVVDEQGAVVGVVYAKATPGTGQNQFFAIAGPLAQVAAEALKDGDYESFGVWGEPLQADDGSYLGLWVSAVEAGSTADLTGVEPGDIITGINGLAAAADGTLSAYCDVIRTSGSDPITLTILRLSTGEILEGDLGGLGGLVVVDTVDPGASGPSPVVDDKYAQYVSVIDDRQLVSVDIPADWSDLSTAPQATDATGNEYSSIVASTDIDAWGQQFFTGEFSIPGIQLVSIAPPLEDIGDVGEDHYGLTFCELDSVDTGPFYLGYDKREYLGEMAVFVNCGGSSAQLIILVANPADGAYHTLYLAAVLVSPRDEDALLNVLTTLSITSGVQ
jgi:serine protease Do